MFAAHQCFDLEMKKEKRGGPSLSRHTHCLLQLVNSVEIFLPPRET